MGFGGLPRLGAPWWGFHELKLQCSGLYIGGPYSWKLPYDLMDNKHSKYSKRWLQASSEQL